MDHLYAVRKANLQAIVLQKFQGNKSAFGRAADVHHNHVNLLLSTNAVHRRNMGEDLARRIEQKLGLPPMWLDRDHAGESVSTAVIASLPIGEGLGRILRTPPVQSITVSHPWISTLLPEITGTAQLFIAGISTEEVAPALLPNDIVLVDAGVKAFTVDGIYILLSGGDAHLRHIRKKLTGGYTLESAGSTEQTDTLDGLKVAGRVVQKIHMGRI